VVSPSDDAAATFPRVSVAGPDERPGVVLAAAVVTWTIASMTAALTLGLLVLVLFFGGPVLDAFQGQDLRVYVVAAALVVIAFAAAADVLAYLVFRRHRWARWALVGLSVVSAVCAAMLGYYVAPLLVTVAALAVVVLLLMRPARAWFRSSHR
jgi:hypothetical protein